MHPHERIVQFFAAHSGDDQLSWSEFKHWLNAQPGPINRHEVEKELTEWHVRGDIALIVIDGPTFIIPLT